jgi:membrane protein DedA with SNARE-associated domain
MVVAGMVEFGIDLGPTAVRFIRLYGLFALLVFTFLEMSMLFPFFPSEVVVPGAAALLIVDPVSFLLFVTVAAVGGTIGAFVPFYAFRGPGSRGLGRLRDRINVSEESIDRGRRWFRRWGTSSVFWGRFLPVLRSVVSIPAGIARMGPFRFGVYTAAGTVLFYAAVGAVVYYGRRESVFAAAGAVAADRPILTAVVVALGLLIGYLILTRSRGEKHRS